ncbi:MAG: hypothetical protein QG567_1380, partial [Campylobacterota bacterium]|nr:hypothetical protein [Campylobacterota bacterium]
IGLSMFDFNSLSIIVAFDSLSFESVSMYELVLDSKTASRTEQTKETNKAIRR